MAKRRRRKRQESFGEGAIRISLLPLAVFIYAGFVLLKRSPLQAISLIGLSILAILTLVLYLYLQNKDSKETTRRRIVSETNWANLSPDEFEQYVSELFRTKGFTTTITGRSGDGGVDIRAAKGDNKVIIQCKRYRGVVGVPEMREFASVVQRAGVKVGYFVTTSHFSHEAEDWALMERIELVDQDRLSGWAEAARLGPYAKPSKPVRLIFRPRGWAVVFVLLLVADIAVSLASWTSLFAAK